MGGSAFTDTPASDDFLQRVENQVAHLGGDDLFRFPEREYDLNRGSRCPFFLLLGGYLELGAQHATRGVDVVLKPLTAAVSQRMTLKLDCKVAIISFVA